jgi:hypothetical protein
LIGKKDYYIISHDAHLFVVLFLEFFDAYAKHVDTMMTATRWDFKVVIDVMIEAIQSSHPPAQLVIGSDARYTMTVLRMLPQWLRHVIVQIGLPNQTPAMLQKKKGARVS